MTWQLHPKFNCSIDPENGEIVYKQYYNIGIAMDTPKGLLVPVIQDGDKKNMVELAVELKKLSEKAREGIRRSRSILTASSMQASSKNRLQHLRLQSKSMLQHLRLKRTYTDSCSGFASA